VLLAGAPGIGKTRLLCRELVMHGLGRRLLRPEPTEPWRHPVHKAEYSVGTAGLSNRELEVLRLVAQGRTNRQIAEALALSGKTVARHVTHIFTRTEVENRASAVTFALRHGLA
jgi:NarL family two-component system response regulator LiaR